MDDKNEIKVGVGGFLRVFEVLMFVNSVFYLLGGLVVLRSLLISASILCFLFSILFLVIGILIKKKKRVVKKIVFILESIEIISSVLKISSNISSGDLANILTFSIKLLISIAVIMYFIRSRRVQNTLVE